MLVMSRQVGDSIMVGDDVEVTVLAIDPTFVRLDVRHTTLNGRMTLDGFVRELTQGVEVALPVAGTCTVYDIRDKVDVVRLRITAPKELSVHRKEVYEAIRRENRRRGLL